MNTSASAAEREDEPACNMADLEDQSSLEDHPLNDDGNPGAPDDDIATTSPVQMGKAAREITDSSGPISNGAISRRYQAIMREQADESSDNGSVDAIPKRAGSPIDSLLSIPDDTPSIQVSSPKLS